jgi:SNF family Na+-dependent transporter
MPAIFATSGHGATLGGLWFGLLFMAGLTSSVSMGQPIMCFLQEEFRLSRARAAWLVGGTLFVTTHLCICLTGALDVMDFWAGTFGPPLLALIEAVLLMWVFGGERTWTELHRGADLRAPRFFYYAAKYVTPAFLSLILVSWAWQNLTAPAPGRGVEGAGTGPSIWITRVFLLALFAVLSGAAHVAWRRRSAETGR